MVCFAFSVPSFARIHPQDILLVSLFVSGKRVRKPRNMLVQHTTKNVWNWLTILSTQLSNNYGNTFADWDTASCSDAQQ